jgi:hypothetical protein
MRHSRNIAAAALFAALAAGTLTLARPTPAAAEKTPVDCSGRRTDCFLRKECTQWIGHTCYEYTSRMWYWYT